MHNKFTIFEINRENILLEEGLEDFDDPGHQILQSAIHKFSLSDIDFCSNWHDLQM